MKNVKKFILIILILSICTGVSIGNFLYNIILNPIISKDIVYAEHNEKNTPKNKGWIIEKSNYKNIYINSSDGLNLHASIIENNNSNKWVIVVHGYGGNGNLVSDKAKYFYDRGYNVIVPDLRGHGKSEGDYIGMGWDDRLDIISWINYIIKDNSKSEIVLHGTSMGASTVLMASGEELPSNVKAIISDCAYTSVLDVFKYELDTYFNLPSFPLINLTDVVTMAKAGYSLDEASALNQVKKSKVPILFIHGDNDKFVPYYMMNQLYNATNSPKEKLTVEGAVHSNSHLVSPFLYWLTINDFLDKYVTI